MKIFVTGASGGVGSALIPKLIASDHTVTGLSRSASSATKLEATGATTARGDVTDLTVCSTAASQSDAVIHLAFDHHQAFGGDFAGACAKDRDVIKAMCNALTSGGIFVFCSGTLGIEGDSETAETHKAPQFPRWQSTDLAFSYVSKGLRVVQVRLAPITYGAERPHDFIGMHIGQARRDGYAAYLGNAAWPACTLEDCGDLFSRIIGNTTLLNPCTLHGVTEEGIPIKQVVEVLGRKLGVPVMEIQPSEAKRLGFLGGLMSMAKPAKADWTKEQTGWTPGGKGLLAQLEEFTYRRE